MFIPNLVVQEQLWDIFTVQARQMWEIFIVQLEQLWDLSRATMIYDVGGVNIPISACCEWSKTLVQNWVWCNDLKWSWKMRNPFRVRNTPQFMHIWSVNCEGLILIKWSVQQHPACHFFCNHHRAYHHIIKAGKTYHNSRSMPPHSMPPVSPSLTLGGDL